jgi:hypothetical protein
MSISIRLLSLTLLLYPCFSSAGIINNQNSFIDEDSSLEWFKLSLSKDLTTRQTLDCLAQSDEATKAVSVACQLLWGSDYQLASDFQLKELYDDLGILSYSTSVTEAFNTDFDSNIFNNIMAASEYFGTTVNTGNGISYIDGFLGIAKGKNSDLMLIGASTEDMAEYGWGLRYNVDFSSSPYDELNVSPYIGTYLVRSSITVPEPSTLAIFALGLAGLAARKFKKII